MSEQYEPSEGQVADEVRALNALLGTTYIQQAVVNTEALRRIAVRNIKVQHALEGGQKEALGPCPFCGCKPWLVETGGGLWHIRCSLDDPDCEMRPRTDFYAKREACVSAWNRRASGRL